MHATPVSPYTIQFMDFTDRERWVHMAFPLDTTRDDIVKVARTMVDQGKAMRVQVLAPAASNGTRTVAAEFGWQRYSEPRPTPACDCEDQVALIYDTCGEDHGS